MLAAQTKAAVADTSSATSDSPLLWREVIDPIEHFLADVTKLLHEQIGSFEPKVAEFVEYAMDSQGKQLRPALIGLSGNLLGNTTHAHAKTAVIIEMVHLATLVHDDIMDEAVIRRKRPTLASHSGNSISVLVGDCLFAHALELAAGFPTPDICRAVSKSTKTVCSGEILQTLETYPHELNLPEYFRILDMKTAELFALSCELGAWLNNGDKHSVELMRCFGRNLGIAYQVYDDCIDLFGSEDEAGKSLGTDLTHGKITLPLIILAKKGREYDREILRNWITNWSEEKTPALLRKLEEFNALDESIKIIHNYLDDAVAALSAFDDSPARKALMNMAHFISNLTGRLNDKPRQTDTS
ncbi:MAG: polyprenyl synthetase family protein [Verrucomicrobia bacterium]|nr:polyprenyl synthetase family protein [Verrucomicrobiota bacterium]MCF7709028.1 polyprenyl synthetase family protein [Verrucomicrobiota bacterium]